MLKTHNLIAMAVLSCCVLHGQEFRATLVGRVSDPSGGAIPKASVVVTQRETNAQHRAVSTETGDFTVPFLAPGAYRVEVDMPGFRKYVRDNVLLRIQDRVNVDVKMEIGSQTETVTVQGAATILETSTASVGSVVSQQAVADAPLNGRNPYGLMSSVTGVLPTGRGTPNFQLRITATGTSGAAEISISGAPANYNGYLLDGVPTTGGDNGLMYVPSIDATQEFKVQTNSYDAEFGRFLGGVINASMRSGSNAFHGSAFEYLRNSALNARDFFAATKPIFAYNQFGIESNGPVLIPRIYNGKNRTFFFGIYDGSREAVPRSFVGTVPTLEQRKGDFSQTFTRVGTTATPVTIYDPSTTRSSGGAFVRNPFPGNIIPAAQLNAVGANLLKFYPLPATAGDSVTHAQNNPLAFTDPVFDDGYAFKIDHKFSEKHQIFVRYSWRHFFVEGQGELKNASTGRAVNRYTPGLAFDDTLTLNPSTVLNVRYGFSRYRQITQADSFGVDLTSLGFAAAMARAINRPAIPSLTVSGYSSYGQFNLDDDIQETHFLHGSLMKQKGGHALRMGFGETLNRHNNGPGGTTAGAYSFDNTFTRGPNPQATSAIAGNAIASLLLGLGASGSVTYTPSLAESTKYTEFYFQDDWRVTSHLSLNVGVRYEWEGAHVERFNQFNRGYDFVSANPLEKQAVANYALNPITEVPASKFTVKGGLLFVNQNGLPRGLANIDRNNISPRAGFAYSLGKSTVLRGGFGRFYGPTTSQTITSNGFSAVTTWVTSVDGGLTAVDKLDNPFPKGITPPAGTNAGLLTQTGQSVTVVDPGRQQLYTNQFDFSIQRQLPGRMVLEALYSGTRGGDYPVTNAIDSTPDNFRAAARDVFVATKRNILNDSVANPFFGLIPAGSLSTATTTRAQLMRPYPQFTGISFVGTNLGSSQYDSLQWKVSKRMAGGVTFLASYTLSKLIEKNFYLNPTDAQLSRRLASFDVPQRFVLTGSYQLPFGKGRRLLSATHGPLQKLVQGWQMNWVYTAQSGVPISIASGESTGKSAYLPDGERTLQRWFDTSAFRLRETLELVGTALLPNVRTQGRNNVDFSLYKDTQLFETVKLQFRAESFNLLNHAEFGNPNATVGSASFGLINSQINFARQLQFGLRLAW